ncbi:hypothetical protein KEM48_006548, partial [Puccinia striiformis f. sp. tritici PST-130]
NLYFCTLSRTTPANNQHTANLAIQSAPPANYYHQQPATDHGTHPNHQSLQQHYSGAPPADQSARGHNNGAPWPDVYVSHNNYGAPPANESASDPNYGAPATDHGTHPNHQSLQQHYSGAPPADHQRVRFGSQLWRTSGSSVRPGSQLWRSSSKPICPSASHQQLSALAQRVCRASQPQYPRHFLCPSPARSPPGLSSNFQTANNHTGC